MGRLARVPVTLIAVVAAAWFSVSPSSPAPVSTAGCAPARVVEEALVTFGHRAMGSVGPGPACAQGWYEWASTHEPRRELYGSYLTYQIVPTSVLDVEQRDRVATVSGRLSERWTFDATTGPSEGGGELPVRATLELRDGRWVITSVLKSEFHGQWTEVT